MRTEFACANCGILIHWQPTIVEGRTYCCLGCAEGGPCKCDYDNLPTMGEMKAMVLQQTGRRSRTGDRPEGRSGV